MPQSFASASGNFALPGANNTYIKSHDATGKLIIGFSRNPKDFPLNRYIQIKEVKKSTGFYLEVTAEEAGRLAGSNLSEFVWPDGADRPRRNAGLEQHRFRDYHTERFDFDFTLGYKAMEQADWDVRTMGESTKAQQAMTARTFGVHSVLSNENNWDAAHVASVDAIGENQGSWELSTTQRGDIKRSINYGRNVIRTATLSKIKQKKDMVLVMNPVTAQRIGESQELRDYIKGSEDAFKEVVQEEGRYSEYGLPNKLYGVDVEIEDTVMVTSARGAATVVRADVMADGIVYMLSRPGGIVAPAYGGPSFSTCTLLVYEEMTVETLDDKNNRRTDGHIVDDYSPVLTAPASGFKFNAVIE